jgi:hypothetical protein
MRELERFLVIATAGLRPDQLDDATGARHPRVDYVELQRRLDVRVLDYGVYNRTRLGRVFRHLETQVRSDLYLTWRRSRSVHAGFATCFPRP